MDLFMIVLRLTHIVLGVFWAGTLLFAAIFLEPAVRAVGPTGGQVMMQLKGRRYFDVLPVVAVLTILSGFALFWRLSDGFKGPWMMSRTGTTLSVGALAALIAFAIGMLVMRASTLRAMALGQDAQQLPEGAERDAQLAVAQSLRLRARTGLRWVAFLLGVAVVTMAVARYV